MEIFHDYEGKQGLCASLCVCIHIYATEKQSIPVHLCNLRAELEGLLSNLKNLGK